MKRSKRIYLLLFILLLTSIATYAVKQYEEHKENIKNREEIILQIPSDSVKTLSWKHEGESLSFHKEERWLYDEDEAFPVDEEKIGELLGIFEEFKASFIIEDVEDYGQYGLDNPICTINITTDEESYEILVGDYSIMDAQRYVSIGDGNVYLVKKDPMDHFELVLSDLIDHDETPFFSNNVTKIQFTGVENYTIVYEEESEDTYAEDVYFIKGKGENIPLDTSRVNSYLSKISHLSLTEYITYKATEKDIEKYGLDDPELTVTVDYTSKDEEGEEVSESFVLNISRDPKERKDADKDSEEEEITAYVRVGNSKIIYRITSDDYKDLMVASYDDFRHLELFYGDFEDIEKIDISLEGKDYTITAKKRFNKRTYHYEDEEIEILDLKNALMDLKAESFTDEMPKDKKEIGLILHLDKENFPQIKIDLYRYDGGHCLAVVDGEPVSLIKRSRVVDLIEAVYAIVLG